MINWTTCQICATQVKFRLTRFTLFYLLLTRIRFVKLCQNVKIKSNWLAPLFWVAHLNERCMVAPAVRQNKYKLLDCKVRCVLKNIYSYRHPTLSILSKTHWLQTSTIKEPFFIIKLQSQKSTLASRLIKILSLSRLHRTFLSPTLSLFLKENELEFFHL